MSRKINPFVFRLGVIENWRSRWFSPKQYKHFLREDYFLRDFVYQKFRKMGLEKIEITRSAHKLTVSIFTSRPGLIIGKSGGGVEALKNELEKKYDAIKIDPKAKVDLRVQIEEISKPDSHAQIVAQQVADQIEKRLPFRRVLKQSLAKTLQNKEVKGAKIKLSGRLGGSEMSRVEWLGKGKIPLQTLRANVDFAKANAYCTYGVIGVKVWIYKGEVFNDNLKIKNQNAK